MLPLDGGGIPAVLASGSYPSTLALDGTSIYWSTLDSVMKESLDGGRPTMIAGGQKRPRGLAVDTKSVYWTSDDGNIMKVTPK